jgi:hypothetical protein
MHPGFGAYCTYLLASNSNKELGSHLLAIRLFQSDNSISSASFLAFHPYIPYIGNFQTFRRSGVKIAAD